MPKRNSLEIVAQSILTALKASGDKRLASYCAEYLVALKLAQKGHNVDVLQKRRGPDIYLRDIDKYVEVKSGHADLSDWDCTASFSTGESIKNKRFDYCVCVVFRNLEPSEFLVFRVEELKEVADKPRPYPITAFPNNPCALFRYDSLKEYEDKMKGNMLDVEIQLHRYPGQFRDKWDKIV